MNDSVRLVDVISKGTRGALRGLDDEFNDLHNKITDLQKCAEEHNLFTGEALIMINKNYGYVWDTIPYGKFGELKQFLCNHAGDEKYRFLNPRIFEELKKQEEPEQYWQKD